MSPARHACARRRASSRGLKKLYPDGGLRAGPQSALELLVATILSAQCTDQRVNLVTPALFAKYQTVPRTTPPPSRPSSRR